jgi:hypothetical protein
MLNHVSKAREVINEVRQVLMANNVDVPLVKVLQHPRLCICLPIGVTADVHVHNLDLCQSSCKPA